MTDIHSCSYYCDRPECIKAQRDQLRGGLLERETNHEPVAWQWLDTGTFRKHLPKNTERSAWRPLYTNSPQREWQGLTDEEANELTYASIAEIEAKLKEKNT